MWTTTVKPLNCQLSLILKSLTSHALPTTGGRQKSTNRQHTHTHNHLLSNELDRLFVTDTKIWWRFLFCLPYCHGRKSCNSIHSRSECKTLEIHSTDAVVPNSSRATCLRRLPLSQTLKLKTGVFSFQNSRKETGQTNIRSLSPTN